MLCPQPRFVSAISMSVCFAHKRDDKQRGWASTIGWGPSWTTGWMKSNCQTHSTSFACCLLHHCSPSLMKQGRVQRFVSVVDKRQVKCFIYFQGGIGIESVLDFVSRMTRMTKSAAGAVHWCRFATQRAFLRQCFELYLHWNCGRIGRRPPRYYTLCEKNRQHMTPLQHKIIYIYTHILLYTADCRPISYQNTQCPFCMFYRLCRTCFTGISRRMLEALAEKICSRTTEMDERIRGGMPVAHYAWMLSWKSRPR